MRLNVRHETDAAAIASALDLVTEEYQRAAHTTGRYLDEANPAPRVFNCYDDAGELVGTVGARLAHEGFRAEYYFDVCMEDLFPVEFRRDQLIEFTQLARRSDAKYARVFLALMGGCLDFALSQGARGWFGFARPERLDFVGRHGFPGEITSVRPVAERIPLEEANYFKEPGPRIYICHGPEAFRFSRRWLGQPAEVAV